MHPAELGRCGELKNEGKERKREAIEGEESKRKEGSLFFFLISLMSS